MQRKRNFSLKRKAPPQEENAKSEDQNQTLNQTTTVILRHNCLSKTAPRELTTCTANADIAPSPPNVLPCRKILGAQWCLLRHSPFQSSLNMHDNYVHETVYL